MKLRKGLSQVFLRDPRFIKKILEKITINHEDVIEVGSGDGALSRSLAREAKALYCVELDERLSQRLSKGLEQFPNAQVINADILSLSLRSLSRKFTLVGNIPYHISKKFIRYLIDNRSMVRAAYLTVQKEFADKLLARPKTSAYCPLSCFLQFYATVTRFFNIPSSAFYPAPKVKSSFLMVHFHDNPASPIDHDCFFEVIDRAFSQRRKKIINSLSSLFNPDELSHLKIDSDSRAQDLSVDDYRLLADSLERKRKLACPAPGGGMSIEK